MNIELASGALRRARAQAVHQLAVSLIHRLTPRIILRSWGIHWE